MNLYNIHLPVYSRPGGKVWQLQTLEQDRRKRWNPWSLIRKSLLILTRVLSTKNILGEFMGCSRLWRILSMSSEICNTRFYTAPQGFNIYLSLISFMSNVQWGGQSEGKGMSPPVTVGNVSRSRLPASKPCTNQKDLSPRCMPITQNKESFLQFELLLWGFDKAMLWNSGIGSRFCHGKALWNTPLPQPPNPNTAHVRILVLLQCEGGLDLPEYKWLQNEAGSLGPFMDCLRGSQLRQSSQVPMSTAVSLTYTCCLVEDSLGQAI